MPIDKANPEPFLDIEIMEDEESALAISGQTCLTLKSF